MTLMFARANIGPAELQAMPLHLARAIADILIAAPQGERESNLGR